MKKVLTILVLSILPILVKSETVQIDDIWYNLTNEGQTAEVTSNPDGTTKYTDVITIPATVTYEGVEYSVTSIAGGAFISCVNLTAVTIPENVTSIGIYAFAGCSGLTSMTIPKGVTGIGIYTFAGCI